MQLGFFGIKTKNNSYGQICKELSNKEFLTPDEFGEALRLWSKNSLGKEIKTLGLFSGAGGLDLGFHDVGFNILETVELESKFVKSQITNQENGKYLQGANIICQDIREYEPTDLPKIDFIIGGPPCQSFSSAGRRAAGVRGTKDSRGELFWEYVRILEVLQPKGFLFENVYGLLGAEKGEAIKKIENAFRKVGYNLSYRILDAADYGVPQHRERLIIVGVKEGKFKFPKPTNGVDSKNSYPHYSASRALESVKIKSEVKEGINGRFGHLLPDVPPGLNYSFFTEKMGHPTPIFAWRSKFSDFLYKADPDMPVRTLKASGGQYTGPFHWENRKFTIEELKRLQTFPDDYEIVGNYGVASKQIGNSVPPQFARVLAISILDQVFGIKPPFAIEYLKENESLSFRKEKSKRTKLYAQKAKEAIELIETTAEQNLIIARKYQLSITDNFKSLEGEEGDYSIEFIPNKKKWTLKVSERNFSQAELQYIIKIKPSKKVTLFDEVEQVEIMVASLNINSITAAWKAFEKELSKAKIKADLVQLSGYYQYSSNLKFSVEYLNSELIKDETWNVISLIANDPMIGDIQSLEKLSKRYEVDEISLATIFKQLRVLGFEIRNNNTNPEIPENHFLIPYKFPTLTPLSVQLNKNL